MNSSNYQRVRILFADQLNLARGKYIPIDTFDKSGNATVNICRSLYGVNYNLDLLPIAGTLVTEGIGDMEMRMHFNHLRPGWEKNTQVVIPELYDKNGDPLALDGRGALMRAVEKWQAHGFEPYLGIELEANLFEIDGDRRWRLYASPSAYAYSTGIIADPARVADTLWESASAMNLPLDAINGEYDQGCYELTLKHRPAVEAIDDIFMFRTMAKEVTYQNGRWLSFMPKAAEKAGGCGLHINFSLFDNQGHNALNDHQLPDQISDLAQRCLAGWMEYLLPSTALLAPIDNSYLRLQPAAMAGYWRNWAVDHRGVSVRVSHEGGSRRRLEHRTADCAANPYVAAAVLLNSARLGFEKKLTLQDPESGDCLENQQATEHVPSTLAEAVDLLDKSQELRDEMGAMLVDNFVEMKRNEIEKLSKMNSQQKINYYFPFI